MDTDIMVALRTATATEHARLDAALDLLADDGRHRIVKLLARLHGFHQVWQALIGTPARVPFGLCGTGQAGVSARRPFVPRLY